MEKNLYVFKNLCISFNNINMIGFDLYTFSGKTQPYSISFHFFRDEDTLEAYERLTKNIEPYIDIRNSYEKIKMCDIIVKSVLYIALMYTENPTLDHSEFEHILSYSKHGEHEIYSVKGIRYLRDFKNNITKCRYKYSFENRFDTLIKKLYKYLFGIDSNINYSRKPSLKKLEIEKESNMEIFVSKKKKDGSLYLVDKCGNKAVSIKLPNELKKAFEKAASVKLKDDKEISLLPNKILLYRKSGNTKEDLEKTKSIILSWLPEEKYRKMLFTSFVLLLIKIKSKHISIDKDIFERFKITDTKASYDKLYDIADLLIKVKFDKRKYKAMKEEFSLD